jgi:hypothetical protein
MTNSFWEILDTVLGPCAAGDKKAKTAEALAEEIGKSSEWSGGAITSFDVERELRGSFAMYSNWAISNYGDHWEFIRR